MPQDIIAIDAKGNRVRWDGSAWTPIPPETAPVTPNEKPSFAEQLKKVNWSRGGKNTTPDDPDVYSKRWADIPEALGNALSGLVSSPVSTAIAAGLQTPGVGKLTLPPEAAEQAAQGVGEKLTIQPKSPAAAKMAESLGTPFAPYGMAINAMPDAQTRTAMTVALMALPLAKGLKGGPKGVVVPKPKGGPLGIVAPSVDVMPAAKTFYERIVNQYAPIERFG